MNTTTTRGTPCGNLFFGRFTAEDVAAFQAGLLDEAIEARRAAVPPVLSREEEYAALWG